MSVALVQSEVRRFLQSTDPEVLCLRGNWGVGKTYSWNHFLKDAQDRNEIGFKRYAYVSLFGLKSLEELRFTIFENTLETTKIGNSPNLDTLRDQFSSVSQAFGRKAVASLSMVPKLNQYAPLLQSISYLSVTKTIICIDDIERRSNSLPIGEVMGLVSQLKDQKRCKIVLILNQGELGEPKEQEAFDTYKEKVIDIWLDFEPSAEDCARIALAEDSETNRLLSEACIDLGISNIRLIKKIERLANSAVPALAEYHKSITHQAIKTLALVSWGEFDKTDGPPIEYLQSRSSFDKWLGSREDNQSADEERWAPILNDYGFSHFDEMDLVLWRGVQKGYFDMGQLAQTAATLDKLAKDSVALQKLEAGWNAYHQSFANNVDDVATSIFEACMEGVHVLTPMNLNAAVTLLKELGKGEEASTLIDHYFSQRAGDDVITSFDDYAFAQDVTDGELQSRFRETAKREVNGRNARDVLEEMQTNSWSGSDEVTLSETSVAEYYEIFKSTEGELLPRIVRRALRFRQISNQNEYQKKINAAVEEALKQIAAESPLNKLRVRKFGIDL